MSRSFVKEYDPAIDDFVLVPQDLHKKYNFFFSKYYFGIWARLHHPELPEWKSAPQDDKDELKRLWTEMMNQKRTIDTAACPACGQTKSHVFIEE